MKRDINKLQFPKPIIKKVAVGHKMRQQLSDMSDKLYENTFMSQVMDKASKEIAQDVDDRIYDALRTKIEFTVTWYGGTLFEVNIKDIFSIPEDTRNTFLKEMFLNLREQYGN
jgi:hypothetical protein